MQYAYTFALLGATLATLAAGIPSAHHHAHVHRARDAEPDTPVVGPDNVVQWEMKTVVATQYVTAPVGAATSAPAAAAPVVAAPSSAAAPVANAAVQKANDVKAPVSVVSAPQSFGSAPTNNSPGKSPSTGYLSNGSQKQLTIHNACDKSIWIGFGNDPMTEVKPGDDPFTAPIQGSAQCYKVGFDSQASWTGTNAEVEFTVTGADSMFYDLSLQKGNPLLQYGQSLMVEDDGCDNVHCKPGEFPCPNAYNVEEDNTVVGQPSLPCGVRNMQFVACSGGQ